MRGSRRAPLRAQIKLLRAAGVETIYNAEEQTVDSLVRALRLGDEVKVTTLARLAKHRRDLGRIVDAIHDKGAVVVEVVSGRRSDNARDHAKMIFDAVDEIASDGRGLPSEVAKTFGKMGAAARAATLEAARMPRHEAEKHWFDARNATTGDALAKMPGWALPAAYKYFGPRKLGAGRPRRTAIAERPGDAPRLVAGSVYFLLCSDNRVKIGTTTNIKHRMSGIQNGQSDEVKLLVEIQGSYETEKALHQQFKRYRIRGEWFRYEGKLKTYVGNLMKKKPTAT